MFPYFSCEESNFLNLSCPVENIDLPPVIWYIMFALLEYQDWNVKKMYIQGDFYILF